MERTLSKKFPIVGYIAVWPSNRIVKVKIDRFDAADISQYPFKVMSLEKGVKISDSVLHTALWIDDGWYEHFYIVDPSLITLYPSQRKAERAELEKLHDQHLQEKIALSKQAKRVKLANKRIFEYKAFKQIQTI